jgi:hypothetical protein
MLNLSFVRLSLDLFYLKAYMLMPPIIYCISLNIKDSYELLSPRFYLSTGAVHIYIHLYSVSQSPEHEAPAAPAG